MKPISGPQNIGIDAANQSDDSALTTALAPSGEGASAGVESKAEIPLSRKRGAFLSSRFFSGKDKDLAVPPDEKSSVAQPLTSEIEELSGSARETEPPSAMPVPAQSSGIIPRPATETLAAASLPKPVSPEPLASKLALTGVPAPLAPSSISAATQPRPLMASNDTARSTDTSRALAELTIGFEIVSLQLTPYFKLGPLELKALSNVVSLHLTTAQEGNHPLAAGISFQIEEVDLDDAAHFKSLLLKPLGELREVTPPRSALQVDHVVMTNKASDAPIAVAASTQVSTPVQVFGSFIIAEIDFTPAFEIGSLRLVPAANTMRVRVAPSSLPTAQDPSLSFEIAEVRVGDSVPLAGLRLLPVPVRSA